MQCTAPPHGVSPLLKIRLINNRLGTGGGITKAVLWSELSSD